MAKQPIIPFFITHHGCPHKCIYCNIHKISGMPPRMVNEQTFNETVRTSLKRANGKSAQIAFYGGDFTGLDEEDQRRLLGYVRPLIRQGMVNDIRISTRPDSITRESLSLLKEYNVSTVEIGAQSLVDDVLRRCERGHTADDVRKAMELLREGGFKTGVHLMAGLPGDNRKRFEYTVNETIALKPDMVRIHPTLVFENTELATLYLTGNYTPLTLDEAVEWCKYALEKFENAGISVIRLGIQTNSELEKEGSLLAGPYHPAFRAVVEESITYDMASSLLSHENVENKDVTFFVSPEDLSYFRGQRNKNIEKLKRSFPFSFLQIVRDPGMKSGTLVVKVGGKIIETKRFGKPQTEEKSHEHYSLRCHECSDQGAL